MIFPSISKKAIYNRTNLVQAEQDIKHIAKFKSKAEEYKIKAAEDTMKTLSNQNMKENSKYQRLNLNSFHILSLALIIQTIMRKTSNKQDMKFSKGEKEGWLSKIL